MKIATWNVNSVRARLEILLNYLKANPLDVIALQELKVVDEQFPYEPFKELGYNVAVNGQKAYNGVAILSKLPFTEIKRDVIESDREKRTIQAEVSGIKILNVYFPHGGLKGEERFFFKLEFYKMLENYIKRNLLEEDKFVLLGDFNVARAEIDVWDPELLRGTIGFMDEERKAIEGIFELGLIDSLRVFHESEKIFTWWDYRASSFRKNEGMRIDYILVSSALKETLKNAFVDLTPRKLQGTSDHTPVIAELT